MPTAPKSNTALVIPPSVQRRAGIKAGDALDFKVSRHTITITVKPARVYQPTTAEWTAIRKGQSEIERGEVVPLSEIIDNLASSRRKIGKKTTRKPSR